MIITDRKVMEKVRKYAPMGLEDDLGDYPDDERFERTDLDFVLDEVDYFIECYNEDGHDWHDDLVNAKSLLKETEDGRVIPISSDTFRPKCGYTHADIERARIIVDDYKRLKSLRSDLNKLRRGRR